MGKIVILVLLALIGVGSYLYNEGGKLLSGGCEAYPEALASCKPFTCEQYIKGPKNVYGNRKNHKITRQIVGKEEDPYYSKTYCNVLETNQTENISKFNCKYSGKALMQAVENANYLFGIKDPQGFSDLSDDKKKDARYAYLKHSNEQQQQCKSQ